MEHLVLIALGLISVFGSGILIFMGITIRQLGDSIKELKEDLRSSVISIRADLVRGTDKIDAESKGRFAESTKGLDKRQFTKTCNVYHGEHEKQHVVEAANVNLKIQDVKEDVNRVEVKVDKLVDNSNINRK